MIIQKRTALKFLSKFVEAFQESVEGLSAPELDKIWDDKHGWDGLIIGRPTRPPAGCVRPVWQTTADKLELRYWSGEPLRFDGVFYGRDADQETAPFPFHVALEHEYVPARFSEEIVKLLSVRCPLKVGIIYYDKDYLKRMKTTEKQICDYFQQFSAIVSESAETQYLFIAGIVRRRPFQIEWKSLSFSATDTNHEFHFAPLQK
ncbi:MAG: hypothetical protein WA737_12025 [Candidatus Acidiferrales bacterium]